MSIWPGAIHNAKFVEKGRTKSVINTYLKQTVGYNATFKFDKPKNNDVEAFATELSILDLSGKLMREIPIGKPWMVRLCFTVRREISNLIIEIN